MSREDRPHIPGALRKAPKGYPAREDATYTELSRQFCAGEIYAYSWDRDRERWEIWPTEADWLATERNGQVRRPDLAAAGHGPHVYVPTAAAADRPKRLTKAQLVAGLLRLADRLPSEALALLEQA